MKRYSPDTLRALGKDASMSYDRVAQGYNDPSHETVRNFEAVTLDFLAKTLFKQVKRGQRVLDLGGGRAYASRRLAKLGSEVLLGDISLQMLRCTKQESVEVSEHCQLSAFELPFQDSAFDVVMTLLCGAYLTERSVSEIFRVLRPEGTYLVTETPTEWAGAIQPQRNMPPDKIWFKAPGGEVVLLPFPFVYTLDELVELLEEGGFEIAIKETLRPNNSIPLESISGVNKSVAEALEVPPREIPLLSAVIAIKPLNEAGKV